MLRCKFQSKLTCLMLFVALFAFHFVSNVAAQKQGKFIETIDIQGNRRLSDEEILKHIKTRLGERLDEKQLQQDLQSLLKLGLFHTTHTRVLTEVGMRGGVNVIFEVYELPLIVKLNFNGLHYVTDKDILAELREQKATVEVGMPYEPQKLNKARQITTEYLVKRGFADAKVEISTEEKSATTLIVTFVIDELPSVDEDDCCEDNAASN